MNKSFRNIKENVEDFIYSVIYHEYYHLFSISTENYTEDNDDQLN